MVRPACLLTVEDDEATVRLKNGKPQHIFEDDWVWRFPDGKNPAVATGK